MFASSSARRFALLFAILLGVTTQVASAEGQGKSSGRLPFLRLVGLEVVPSGETVPLMPGASIWEASGRISVPQGMALEEDRFEIHLYLEVRTAEAPWLAIRGPIEIEVEADGTFQDSFAALEGESLAPDRVILVDHVAGAARPLSRILPGQVPPISPPSGAHQAPGILAEAEAEASPGSDPAGILGQ